MKKALLIIDVQNDYFAGGRSELYNPGAALENIEKLLCRFRSENMPVIYVQHINVREGATFFLPGMNGVLIHETIAPQTGDHVVVKHTPHSLFETNLLNIMQMNAVHELVICGMMSHMCVDTTTRACRDFGIPVTLIDDACATKNLSWEAKSFPPLLFTGFSWPH